MCFAKRWKMNISRGAEVAFFHYSNEVVEDTCLSIHKIIGSEGQINLIFYCLKLSLLSGIMRFMY